MSLYLKFKKRIISCTKLRYTFFLLPRFFRFTSLDKNQRALRRNLRMTRTSDSYASSRYSVGIQVCVGIPRGAGRLARSMHLHKARVSVHTHIYTQYSRVYTRATSMHNFIFAVA